MVYFFEKVFYYGLEIGYEVLRASDKDLKIEILFLTILFQME